MSMTANYRRISQSELDAFLGDSEFAQRFLGFIFGEDDEEDFGKFWDELQNSGNYLDIGKAWHGLHFLLTGEPNIEAELPDSPLCEVVFGGIETIQDMDRFDI